MNDMKHQIQHTFRNEAFSCFDAVKRGREQEAIASLEHMGANLQKSDANSLASAYWLWAVGEHANLGGGRTVIDHFADLVADSIGIIAHSWQKTDSHWLRSDEQGLFLSNLAVYYGALRSINNRFRSEIAQKVCKEIREMTFSSFMKGNHFVSRSRGLALHDGWSTTQGSEEVWDDITAAAVPFGLVSPGDLALLSSIERINEDRMQTDAAALMSWYCSECGQLTRAKHFLDQAGKRADKESQLNSILFALAEGQFESKSSGSGPTDEQQGANKDVICFHHDPIGEECPYIFGDNERSPRLVTTNDSVIIRVFVKPFNPQLPVSLEFNSDHGDQRSVLMHAEQSPGGEPYWQAELVAFSNLAHVAYRFKAASGEQEQTSEWYSFDVLRWKDINQVVHVEQNGNSLSVFFESALPGGLVAYLTVSSSETNEVSCNYALLEAAESARLIGSFKGADQLSSLDGNYVIGNTEVCIKGAKLALYMHNDRGEVISSSYETGGLSLLQVLEDRSGTVYKLRLNLKLTDEERLYGMGERFARMEFRGFEVDNYVYNQYKDQGLRTYIPVPFMFSSRGYGVYLKSSLYSVFRFATVRSDLLQIEADVQHDRQSLEWLLFAGKPLDIIGRFTADTGKPKLPPKWAFGPWMSSNNWDSEREVDWQLAQTAKYEIPSTVMVIEQWSDEATFYIFNDAGYEPKLGAERFKYDEFSFPAWGRWPNPRKLVERIHGQGIKVLLWQAPVMKFMEGIAHAQRDEDERLMLDSGFAVRNKNGDPYRIPQFEWFRGSLVPDFTNQAGAAWWFSKRQYLLDEIGINGFKTDGGECIYGSDVQFHDGRSGAEMRNEYPNTYISAFHNFTNEHVSGGGITFSRAGYTGAQSMPLHWAGDERSTFEAFRSSLIAGLSCGMSGIPFWGWDLGGFNGDIPTAELFIRSAQMAAFCPVMQYHAESKGEFNQDRTPWNIAERTGKPEVLAIYKQYADLRMNLLPYIYEQAQISSISGHPLMQAMLLAYPDDPYCLDLTLQYMFGQCLLVAPVTEEGASCVDVYLPKGNWLSFRHLLLDNDVWIGGRMVTVPASLSQIPVFVRENSVIPLNLDASFELASHVGNYTDRYERLCLMIFITGQINYSFADDLGTNVMLSAELNSNRIEVSVEVLGEYPVTLCFRAIGKAASVVRNGSSLVQALDYEQHSVMCYLQRNNEVLLTVLQGNWLITIELS